MGVTWDRMEDTLKYDLTIFDNHTVDEALTKRKLLTMTARFYDPLGLLSPVIVPFKCMFQEICRLKIGWDEALARKLHLKLEGINRRYEESLKPRSPSMHS